jgi:hypothetical protein
MFAKSYTRQLNITLEVEFPTIGMTRRERSSYYWYQIINPKFYSGVRCIQQQQDGELVKASGNACKRESSTILTLEHQP